MRQTSGGAAVVVRGWESQPHGEGRQDVSFWTAEGSLIGRVLDERGSGPKKIVGTVPATPEVRSAAMDCDGLQPNAEISPNQGGLESRMQGNLHVRFGVGAG